MRILNGAGLNRVWSFSYELITDYNLLFNHMKLWFDWLCKHRQDFFHHTLRKRSSTFFGPWTDLMAIFSGTFYLPGGRHPYWAIGGCNKEYLVIFQNKTSYLFFLCGPVPNDLLVRCQSALKCLKIKKKEFLWGLIKAVPLYTPALWAEQSAPKGLPPTSHWLSRMTLSGLSASSNIHHSPFICSLEQKLSITAELKCRRKLQVRGKKKKLCICETESGRKGGVKSGFSDSGEVLPHSKQRSETLSANQKTPGAIKLMYSSHFLPN